MARVARRVEAAQDLGADAIPKVQDPAWVEFATLRLFEVAVRSVEIRHRLRAAFVAAWPEAGVIAGLSAALLGRRI